MARLYSAPWKHIYGTDRKYTARFDRAAERGQLTAPGTVPNPPNAEKIQKKRQARQKAEWRAEFFGRVA